MGKIGIFIFAIMCHHHHHVPEGLGVLPVPLS
jgi:hypothetical protein